MGVTKLSAVPAYPYPIEETQPDGTKIKIHVRGDEFYHWTEDSDGYTIIQNDSKYWTYAQKNNFGDLKPSEHIVGKVSPKKLNIKKSLKDDYKLSTISDKRKNLDLLQQKTLLKNSLRLNSAQSVSKSSSDYGKNQKVVSPTGTKTNFVLLVQFSDLKFTDRAPFSSSSTEDEIRQEFLKLFNTHGYSQDGAVGSVRDYFKEVSYGTLEYTSVVSPIVTLPNNYSYYGETENPSSQRFAEAIKYALNQLDSVYDFSTLWSGSEPEGFTVIHAGGGAEYNYPINRDYIWSHAWYLSEATGSAAVHDGITFNRYHTEPAGRGYNGNEGITRIGVICHESLHFFGLPDLYDTTYSSSGLGEFSVMASGSWNGSDGKMPAHPDVWCKYTLGWITPQTAITGINYIGQSATDSTAFYIFKPSSFPTTQYFLMENRQSVGFDKGLPGSTRGILIYHIDETQDGNIGINYNYYHYLVDIEEADGTAEWTQDDLAVEPYVSGSDSDYFRSGNLTVFNDSCVSSPNSRSYDGVASGINISGITSSSSNMAFAYGNENIVDNLSNVLSYPNPAKNGYMYITNIPLSTTDFSAEVFTMKGNLVKTFSSNDVEYIEINDTVSGRIKWNCKNDNGSDVAPGVYIVMVKANDKIKKYKVAITR